MINSATNQAVNTKTGGVTIIMTINISGPVMLPPIKADQQLLRSVSEFCFLCKMKRTITISSIQRNTTFGKPGCDTFPLCLKAAIFLISTDEPDLAIKCGASFTKGFIDI